jgi:hypothetical protein
VSFLLPPDKRTNPLPYRNPPATRTIDSARAGLVSWWLVPGTTTAAARRKERACAVLCCSHLVALSFFLVLDWVLGFLGTKNFSSLCPTCYTPSTWPVCLFFHRFTLAAGCSRRLSRSLRGRCWHVGQPRTRYFGCCPPEPCQPCRCSCTLPLPVTCSGTVPDHQTLSMSENSTCD